MSKHKSGPSTAHTPGPWENEQWTIRQERIETSENHFENVQVADGVFTGKERVAVIQATPVRLAAPELLEALKSARGWVSTHAMQTYSRVAARELEQIDALIAKAERKE